MFLNKDFVLANELVQKMGINIANISKIVKDFEDMDYYGDIIQMNNCTFLKRTSHRFPKNIREGLYEYLFTDVSNKLPCRFVQSEYSLTERELRKSGIVIDKLKIAKKEFYVFTDEFVQSVKNMIGYTLNAKDLKIAQDNGDILGSIQMSKNKYLTWYRLYER